MKLKPISVLKVATTAVCAPAFHPAAFAVTRQYPCQAESRDDAAWIDYAKSVKSCRDSAIFSSVAVLTVQAGTPGSPLFGAPVVISRFMLNPAVELEPEFVDHGWTQIKGTAIAHLPGETGFRHKVLPHPCPSVVQVLFPGLFQFQLPTQTGFTCEVQSKTYGPACARCDVEVAPERLG